MTLREEFLKEYSISPAHRKILEKDLQAVIDEETESWAYDAMEVEEKSGR